MTALYDETWEGGKISQILRVLPPSTGTLIACFFTGTTLPRFVEPMSREPIPPVGMPFDRNFLDVYRSAFKLNPAVHDGAILIGRKSVDESYHILGWSLRMFPPAVAIAAEPNRGSAYNSCLAMSVIPSVDLLCLVSHSELIRFQAGVANHEPRGATAFYARSF